MALACTMAGCWEKIDYTEPTTSDSRHRTADQASSLGRSTSQTPPLPTSQPLAEGQRQTPVEPPASSATGVPNVPWETEQPGVATSETNSGPTTDNSTAGSNELPAQTPLTRLAVWRLGSKWSLATLAQYWGLASERVTQAFDEASQAAELAGVRILPLPDTTTGGENRQRIVQNYLHEEGQRIWSELSASRGAECAALFEVAVKSNLLLVLYQPGAAEAQKLVADMAATAPRAALPNELLQPVIDAVTYGSSIESVRTEVRRMHTQVDNYLANQFDANTNAQNEQR